MALTTYNCVALTGGGTRSLDAISVDDLYEGYRAICAVGGDLFYFMFDEDGTDAEDVVNHPYKVRPDDYVDGGVWVEQQVLGAGGGACLGGFKNKIINGSMDIWQRGTSYTGAYSGNFFADRFMFLKSGAGTYDVTRSATMPTVAEAGIRANYSIKFLITAADTSIGSSEYCRLVQRIEGYNIKDMMGKSCTLSFWVKSNKTGTYSISLRSSGYDYSYVTEYTISSANTWEKKTITITMSDGSAGTWYYINGTGVEVSFALVCGLTNQTSTLDQWQLASKFASSNQVNFADTVDNDFYITLIQFEIGEEATSFENRPFSQELQLCQRYFEKSYNLISVPGSVTTTAQLTGIMVSANQMSDCTFQFKVAKRSSPTMYAYSPATGDYSYVRDTTAGADRVATAYGSENHSDVSVVSGGVAGNLFAFHFKAESEL